MTTVITVAGLALMIRQASVVRIGQGFDIHPFCPGRELVLGGVRIHNEEGLGGHSDADAVLHALTDAILGALGAGDIGRLFPDTDPRNRGRDSREFLREAMRMADARGWRVSNVDVTVVCEKPRLAPHIERIREVLAGLLAVDADAVGIKATRAEGIGEIGKGKALAALTVVLLARKEG